MPRCNPSICVCLCESFEVLVFAVADFSCVIFKGHLRNCSGRGTCWRGSLSKQTTRVSTCFAMPRLFFSLFCAADHVRSLAQIRRTGEICSLLRPQCRERANTLLHAAHTVFIVVCRKTQRNLRYSSRYLPLDEYKWLLHNRCNSPAVG